jgi:Fe2+ transport system protein B
LEGLQSRGKKYEADPYQKILFPQLPQWVHASDLLENKGYASEVEKVADELNCPLLSTSAKTGNNVEEAFRTLATSIVDDPADSPAEDESTGSSLYATDKLYTPAEFLDYATVRFCNVLGDEEIGMHMVRKQVKDRGMDFRKPTMGDIRAMIDQLSTIIIGQIGQQAGHRFRQELLKEFDRVRV